MWWWGQRWHDDWGRAVCGLVLGKFRFDPKGHLQVRGVLIVRFVYIVLNTSCFLGRGSGSTKIHCNFVQLRHILARQNIYSLCVSP